MDGSATLGNRPPASGITKLRFRAGSYQYKLEQRDPPARNNQTLYCRIEWQRRITKLEHQQNNNQGRHESS